MTWGQGQMGMAPIGRAEIATGGWIVFDEPIVDTSLTQADLERARQRLAAGTHKLEADDRPVLHESNTYQGRLERGWTDG